MGTKSVFERSGQSGIARRATIDPEIPYLLLTPGPLTTTRSVREAMLHDYSTWDVDYNAIVQSVRRRVTALATPGSPDPSRHACVLMQGSGTFAVEATLGSVVPDDGKLLIISNGAYGSRMAQIAARLRLAHTELSHRETEAIDIGRVREALVADPGITHVAMVHCETTTGILNDIEGVGGLVAEFDREFEREFIVDAMSSLGGVPLDMDACHAHYVISSANKCIQGVPGFGFVVAERRRLERTEGIARSVSLDLYNQWRAMEEGGGKWRFTSPTHVVLAFAQALDEFEAEGGVAARHRRYVENQRALVAGMESLGFRTLLPAALHSPIITSFHCPADPGFTFARFYDLLKSRRFVIYPGKVTDADTFRIGTIGDVSRDDVMQLVAAVAEVKQEMGFAT